jgi:acetylornithine deacetylase
MDPLALLHDLVAVNSVNPALVPGAPGEAEVAGVCARAMTMAGLDVVTQVVQPGRPNVIGVLEGRQPGPSVMLMGHLDTVGIEGMTDPCVPRVESGRLYGRGAQDMKGGVAAMIAAAAAMAPTWTRGRLIVAGVVDEEYESIGAEALVREWHADAAIITEPTGLEVAIAHKGFSWIEIVTRGKAAHGSRPQEGRDAILRMGRVMVALEALDRDLQARPAAGLEGVGSLHASIVAGGRELSSYPDRCALQMERRTVAGESAGDTLDEVQDILRSVGGADSTFEGKARLMTHRPAYRLDAAHPLVATMVSARARAGQSREPIGMSFWTDAAILGEAGIPTVLFGPGGAGLHSLTEYVNVADLYTCRDVLIDAIKEITAA